MIKGVYRGVNIMWDPMFMSTMSIGGSALIQQKMVEIELQKQMLEEQRKANDEMIRIQQEIEYQNKIQEWNSQEIITEIENRKKKIRIVNESNS